MKLAGLILALALPAAAQDMKFPPDAAAIRAALSEAPAPAAPAGTLVSPRKSIWYNPPVPGLNSREAREYADEAARLAAQGLDFPGIFAGLCRRLLDDPRTARNPRREIAVMFKGLIRWTRNGGTSLFQNRDDWPLHFTYGGYIATVYGRGAAEAAAYAKETRDSTAAGNFFDLDDFGVTLLGSRWATSMGVGHRNWRYWIGSWASGQRTLSAVPAFKFGELPHGRLPAPGQIQRVAEFVRRAI